MEGHPPVDAYRSGLDLYRATRDRTLALVEGFSQAQMDYVPAPGRWSAGEVLDHLLLGERQNLSYVATLIAMKKAGKPPVLRLSFSDMDVSVAYLPKSLLPFLEVPFTVMNIFLPRAVRDVITRYRLIPAQNAAATTPRPGRPADQLRQDLISSWRETEALLESNAHLGYDDMLVQHPLLGNNSVPELLRFLALHEERHQSQIQEIRSDSRFPAALGQSGQHHARSAAGVGRALS